MPIQYTQRDPNAFYKGAEFEQQNRLTDLAMQNQAQDRQRRIDRENTLAKRQDTEYDQNQQDRDRELVMKYQGFAQSALQSGNPHQFIADALSGPAGSVIRADGIFDDDDLQDAELPQSLQAFIGLAGPQKPVDPGPMEQIVGPDGNPVFAPRSQVAGKRPYIKPDTTQAADKPQLVDVQMPDGSTQKQWVAPGRTSGPAVGAPKPIGTQAGKPLPVGALRMIDDAKQAIGSVAQSKTMIDSALNTLNSGAVDLGLFSNAMARAKNYAGSSDPQSRAYAGIKQTFEKLRNNYLLLAKGVQTEGDAKRAWNAEIGESVQNDNKLAKQQLERAESLMQQMQAMQQDRISTVYANYGAVSPEDAVPTTTQPAQSQPVRVNTPAEAAKLPSGTQFVTPDGQVRVKR